MIIAYLLLMFKPFPNEEWLLIYYFSESIDIFVFSYQQDMKKVWKKKECSFSYIPTFYSNPEGSAHSIWILFDIAHRIKIYIVDQYYITFFSRYVKVRQSQNDFFKPTFPPKTNEQIQLYYYDTSGWFVFVHFLEEIDETKKTFQN